MSAAVNLTKPRLLLFSSGAVSVAFALMHFVGRGSLEGEPAVRASQDLVGLSMLFAGLVTITVAWVTLSAQLLSGYAVLYGAYYGGHAWVQLFAGIGWPRGIASLVLALASFLAAYLIWAGADKAPPEQPQ